MDFQITRATCLRKKVRVKFYSKTRTFQKIKIKKKIQILEEKNTIPDTENLRPVFIIRLDTAEDKINELKHYRVEIGHIITHTIQNSEQIISVLFVKFSQITNVLSIDMYLPRKETGSNVSLSCLIIVITYFKNTNYPDF